MINKILVLLLFISCIGLAQPAEITSMSNHTIDSILTSVSSKNLKVTDRMKFYSELFLNMPYDLTCAGEGPYALYESEPLVNFDSTNCMVYVEHVLALSISDSWDNFFNNLQQIRYKDGIIGMRQRNHYTMVDWLPENRWLLYDVSNLVGDDQTKQMTRKISHKKFFEGKGISDLRYVKEDRSPTIDYLTFDALKEKVTNLESGDVLALLFAKLDNIFAAHMLMYFEEEGKGFIRESAMSKMTTFDTPIDEWISKYIKSERYAGVAVMRLKEEINKPGKIILPWNIADMRK
jgi:hypothetical protein